MTRKSVTLLGIAAATVLVANAVSVAPVAARTTCYYAATNGFTFRITTVASARRASTACRRAKRRCNRKLRRAKRRHQISRGNQTPRCRRTQEASKG